MIKAENIHYSIGTRVIFDDVSFNINKGNKVALVGANGTGKSTLIRIILGQIIPSQGKVSHVSKSQQIGYMPQQIADLGILPHKSVTDFMLSGRGLDELKIKLSDTLLEMENQELPEKEMMNLAHKYSESFDLFMGKGGYGAENEMLEVLIGLGLSEIDLDQIVSTMSGGQKTKLALARVLFSKPDLMILDEPTNHLDEETITWVAEYLKEFRGTLIIISHTPSLLDEIINRLIYLDGDGQVLTYKGNFSDFLLKKGQEEIAQEKLHKKQSVEAEKLQAFIDRWRGRKVSQVHDREKKLDRLKANMAKTNNKKSELSLSFPVSKEPVKQVLVVDNVSKSFNDNHVLKNVSLQITRGERVAILGSNGAGKTTFLKIIAGLVRPDSGLIEIGQNVDLGYYAQEQEILDLEKNPLEELMLATARPQSQVRSILAHFLFPGDRVYTKIKSLSLGEKSRLALAKLVVEGHNFLLLDEPTNHLDVTSREQVKLALKKYTGTILIISHDQEFLDGIGVEKVLLLPENKFGFLDQIKS
ncbi:MAG: ABC-F family ATP-binding cassette domain-containing protein [bacterium]